MNQPPEPPPDLSPDEQEAFLQHHGLALNLRDKAATVYMMASASVAIASKVDGSVCATYMEQLRADAKVRDDPIELMMIDQIAIAYHNIGRLHIKAAHADTLKASELYNSAAARLLGEFRRLVLALREYRTPMVARQVTLVNQQNVAAGDQQIAYLPEGSQRGVEKKTGIENGLEKKGIAHDQRIDAFGESTPGGCQQFEPVGASKVYRGGSTEAPGSGSAKSTVAAFDWT